MRNKRRDIGAKRAQRLGEQAGRRNAVNVKIAKDCNVLVVANSALDAVGNDDMPGIMSGSAKSRSSEGVLKNNWPSLMEPMPCATIIAPPAQECPDQPKFLFELGILLKRPPSDASS